MLLFGKVTTANLYSHLEYNAKVASAETIARALDGSAAKVPENNKGESEGRKTVKKADENTEDIGDSTANVV